MTRLVNASGRPVKHDLRAMVDAVFYVVKNGVARYFNECAEYPDLDGQRPDRNLPGTRA
jgi:hypothetical protein